MKTEMSPARSSEDCSVIANLAREIWRQHFTPIIGSGQVEYMVAKFQSSDAVAAQIESGWEYYLAKVNDDAAGYAGLVPEHDRKKVMLTKSTSKNPAAGRVPAVQCSILLKHGAKRPAS